jgi:predicted amidophosphoribosyltransferase
MKCPQCQFENPEDFQFCGKCGQKLGELPETEKTMLEIEGERKHVTVLFSYNIPIWNKNMPTIHY